MSRYSASDALLDQRYVLRLAGLIREVTTDRALGELLDLLEGAAKPVQSYIQNRSNAATAAARRRQAGPPPMEGQDELF